MSNIIFGRNPVLEALKSGREIEKLLIQKDSEGSIKKIESIALKRRIPLQYVERTALNRILKEKGSRSHQGVAAYVATYSYYEIDEILDIAAEKGEDPFLVLLDGIEDPHNLGAIIRTAEGAGVHGIVIPKRRAVGITDAVAKASAGAVEYMPVSRVTNMAQTIDGLKKKGIWIAACHMDGAFYYDSDLTMPIALVVGSEGNGVSRLVLEKSDFNLSIPMAGKITSLNASNAAAILMYEIRRQRNV